jgi:hypothetical protein
MTQTGAAAAPSPSEMPPERRPSAAEAPPSAVQLTVSVPDDDTEVLAAVVWGGVAGSVPPPDGVEAGHFDGAVRCDQLRIPLRGPAGPPQQLRRCGATIVGTASVATDGSDAQDHAACGGPTARRPAAVAGGDPDAETVDLVIDRAPRLAPVCNPWPSNCSNLPIDGRRSSTWAAVRTSASEQRCWEPPGGPGRARPPR